MPIRGHVDDMEGAYAVGWAVADPDSGNCAITVTDQDGRLVAKGRASRHRPDLAALGLGRTSFAFRIPVPHIAEARSLRVFADGEELPGSPLHTGPGIFDAGVGIEADQITGWVSERIADFTPPRITVVNHAGIEVARGAARFEAEGGDPLFRPARFSLRLDDQCFGAGEMMLDVFANGCKIARVTCNLALRGHLEQITARSCLGWLYAPANPRRGFEIELYRDGVLAGEAACELIREDVRGAYPDCVTPGFEIRLDEAEDSQAPVTLSLRFAGSDRELFEGPYVIASRAAAVAALYKVGQLAHAGLSAVERAVLGRAVQDYLAKVRAGDGICLSQQASAAPPARRLRVAVVIPIYRGVEVTRACIESVLAHRDPATDQLILINDCSPDAAMAGMLERYKDLPNVLLLHNDANLGFVRTVNRGLGWARGTDVLLLNSDTVMHAGGLDELLAVAAAHPEVGTVTALSNNATIFSYPSAALREKQLPDLSWPALAALALQVNKGTMVDVPTGHGFCMLIKDEVIRRIGVLDEGFGRGYGEENDFCARTAAIGYRNVAAGGVIVEHKESISFENERASLLAQNLPRLNALYPEYTPLIMKFEAADGMRQLRWKLDEARLARARAQGVRFVLVIANALEGGTPKAIRDIEAQAGYAGAIELRLIVGPSGLMELRCASPLLAASFNPGESAELFALLDQAAPTHVLAHQLLGFPAGFIEALQGWAAARHSVYWVHDFYPLCPRVTMIDAIGRFCGGADTETCARCVEMGGAHELSKLGELTPAAHRALFGGLLGAMNRVVAPSGVAASYIERIFPAVRPLVLPHPEPVKGAAAAARAGGNDELVMLGAIGPHKGSDKLLEIAQRARLTHPHLQFRVIGFTNIDKALKAVGNVTITGKYTPEELPGLLAEAKGRLALFLPAWPETYSYTLSELVRHGFIPLVPDIGAPAQRVREAGFGVVFPFPAQPADVLAVIDGIAGGAIEPVAPGAVPARFFSGEEGVAALRDILAMHPPALAPAAAPAQDPAPERVPARARAASARRGK